MSYFCVSFKYKKNGPGILFTIIFQKCSLFIEAVIQLHLNFLLLGVLATINVQVQVFYNPSVPPIYLLSWLGNNNWVIWLSFSISLSSATIGLSKFIKIGPIKIVNDGPETGHATLVGFGMTMILISSFMTSKAVWVLLNTWPRGLAHFNGDYSYILATFFYDPSTPDGRSTALYNLLSALNCNFYLFLFHILDSNNSLLRTWFQENTSNAFDFARNVTHFCVHAFYRIVQDIE